MENARIAAKELRNPEERAKVPGDRPGYYKWWAKEEDFKYLLEKLNGTFDNVKEKVEKENGWYCIYVGIAVKESIQSRLNWHINQVNNPSNVRSRTLSTLRQSISSVIAGNQLCNDKTNCFIDKLEVEYFYESNDQIGSPEAKEWIEEKERELMKEHLCILNIQGNKREDVKTIKKKLKQLRREGR